MLSLQPPRDESLNGLLQGYRIYYRELEYEAAPATESKTLKTPSALRAELTGEPPAPRPHGREVPITTTSAHPRPAGNSRGGRRGCSSAPSPAPRQCARSRAQQGHPGRLPGGGAI